MSRDLAAIAAQLRAGFPSPVGTADLAWLADIETSARCSDDGETITHDDAKRGRGDGRRHPGCRCHHFVVREIDEAKIDPA